MKMMDEFEGSVLHGIGDQAWLKSIIFECNQKAIDGELMESVAKDCRSKRKNKLAPQY